MNSQQFDNSEPARAQRMTEQETQAVIALWQQEQIEQGGLTNQPALPDVAEGLDISVDDARRLLEQVRSRRTAEEKLLSRAQAEAELEQIRLDEEERKLNEVRRQRAELQRQQGVGERQVIRRPTRYRRSATPIGDLELLVRVIWAVFIVCCIIYALSHTGFGSSQWPNQVQPQSTCDPGYYPLPGHDASYGCTNEPLQK